jgi:hypothetical protein
MIDIRLKLEPETEAIELTEVIDGMRWVWVGNPSVEAITSVVDLVLRQPQPLTKAA